tara:strand:+ start:500 stop:682 length:183 start_codon:yes stop_codon:yes gene_type:complete
VVPLVILLSLLPQILEKVDIIQLPLMQFRDKLDLVKVEVVDMVLAVLDQDLVVMVDQALL